MNTAITNPNGSVVRFTASNGIALTKSDTVAFTQSGIFVGTGGDIAVKFANNKTPVVFANIPDATFLPLQVVAVMSTGTTASDIVRLP